MVRFDNRFTKVDWGFITVLFVFITMTILFSIFDLLSLNYGGKLWYDYVFGVDVWTSVPPTAGPLGFFIIFISCFLGALIPIPVPYFFTVSIVATWGDPLGGTMNPVTAWLFFPLMAAMIGTIGNFSGEIIDFFIGKGSREILSHDTVNKVNKWGNLMERRPGIVPVFIFLFALTPLPDSLLLVPLGLSGYSTKKTLVSCMIGKFCMMMIISYAIGIFGFGFLISLLGGGEGGWITGMILLFITVVIVWLMLKLEFDEKPPKEE